MFYYIEFHILDEADRRKFLSALMKLRIFRWNIPPAPDNIVIYWDYLSRREMLEIEAVEISLNLKSRIYKIIRLATTE